MDDGKYWSGLHGRIAIFFVRILMLHFWSCRWSYSLSLSHSLRKKGEGEIDGLVCCGLQNFDCAAYVGVKIPIELVCMAWHGNAVTYLDMRERERERCRYSVDTYQQRIAQIK